jgi:hypothetical protein
MKLFGIYALLFLSSTASLSQKSGKSIQAVLHNMEEQVQAWNKGDIPEFMEHYWNNDSLQFIGSKGITYGWKTTLTNYLTSYPNKDLMGYLNFSIINTEQLSKTSIHVIGKWELLRENSIGGYFTLLWKKIDGKWVIVADHTS